MRQGPASSGGGQEVSCLAQATKEVVQGNEIRAMSNTSSCAALLQCHSMFELRCRDCIADLEFDFAMTPGLVSRAKAVAPREQLSRPIVFQ